MRSILSGIALMGAAVATPAAAQVADGQETLRGVGAATDHVAAARKSHDFVVMPIPVSNPAVGNGLAIGAMALYSPAGAVEPWTTGAGVLYTDTDSWAAGVFQKANLWNDRLRITAFAGTGDFHLDFYGIGPNAGARDRSIAIEQEGDFALVEALARIADHLYVGPVFRYVGVSTSLDLENVEFPDQDLPSFELESQSSALGLALEYDTRDREYGPRRGLYVTSQYFVADEALGSDFDYRRTQFAANGYLPLSDRAIVAGRLSICDVSDDAPFYDLCAFGQNNDLRGYVSGQYRDDAMVAAQIEYRQDLVGRFGMVIFAGVGGVGSSLDRISDSPWLPAAGVGLRYKASRDFGVNVSVDYAVGKDSDAIYFYIGESF